ncbi:MAG: 30S ribosome-binding factor RbfA [Clostridiales bacterium]|nr:30S ribosome-binding factor RbfA [Clostridiales bacterium]
MGKNFRVNRVAEEIKRVISYMLINELKDPRIAPMSSITGVDVTEDFSYATVYLSVYGTDEEKENTLVALKNAAGFIRKEVGRQVKMRHTPEFLFKLDNSIEYGLHIDKIIDEIGKDNKNNHEE